MSLLRKIQNATIEPKYHLADILRMCKILAARLDHKGFKEWINRELNGYPEDETLPDYRVLKNLDLCGDFYGYNFKWSNASIPLLSLYENLRELLSEVPVPFSVSALENIISQANQGNQSVLYSHLSSDVTSLLRSNTYEGCYCSKAWASIPTAELVAILDIVKNRVLEFALEIEAENPNAGDVDLGEKPIPDAVTNTIFNNCILNQYGDKTDLSENYTNNFQGAYVGNLANTVKDEARQQANQYIHQPEN
jgi:hypothetical protein